MLITPYLLFVILLGGKLHVSTYSKVLTYDSMSVVVLVYVNIAGFSRKYGETSVRGRGQ